MRAASQIGCALDVTICMSSIKTSNRLRLLGLSTIVGAGLFAKFPGSIESDEEFDECGFRLARRLPDRL
jgi:hypothetical protein